MGSESLTLAEQGLAAWPTGDFETLERLLDPAVEWHWVMRFRDGGVVSMQDYRTQPEALAAVAAN